MQKSTALLLLLSVSVPFKGFTQNDGSLDLSFHGNGLHNFTFHSGFNSVYDVDQSGPNAFYILSDQHITLIDSAGNIDLNFANNGVLNTSPFVHNDIAIGNNRLYAGTWDANNKAQIVCYFLNGAIDSTFGNNGVASPNLPQEQIVYDIQIDAQGRLLVAGRTDQSNNHNMMLFRLLPNGTVDNSFGSNGLFTFDANGSNDEIWRIAFQSDGKILCAGEHAMNFNTTAVLRLNTDGTIDNSFGNNGVFRYSVIGRNTHLEDIEVLPDDRIRITGPFDNTTNYRLYVIGLTANGTWDGSWANNGLYIDAAVNRGNGLLLQPDGRLLVAGSDQVSFSLRDDYVVMRLDTNGVLDNSWDGDGVAIVDMAGNTDNLRGVFQLSNGKVLGVGSVRDDNSNRFIGLIRLNNSGALPCVGVQTNGSQWICNGDSVLIHGQWRHTAGYYAQTFTAQNGCDSIHSEQLQVYPSQQIQEVHSACGSFTWIDGITYSQSTSTPQVLLTNQQGCDSLLTLHLTILTADSVIDQHSACGSFTWIDGITYSQSTSTPQVLLTNQQGCDSLLTLDLTILSADTVVDQHSACGSFTWIDGITYSQSTSTPQVLLTNQQGCDSLLVLNLNLIVVDTGLVQNGTTLSATGTANSWQWIDCINGNPIAGEIGQQFTATYNSSFAVIINSQGCVDTSRCVEINSFHAYETYGQEFQVFPNPHWGEVSIQLPPNYANYRLEFHDFQGRLLQRVNLAGERFIQVKLPLQTFQLLSLYGDDILLTRQMLIAK